MWVAWLVLFILKKTNKLRSEWQAQLILLTAVAALCTICFTLIDDVISPLFVGMDLTAALSYFYTSLVAMLPQTICTIVTVSTLFYPITSVLFKIKRQ
jgi:predicted PurR-regulated permease PerM